MVTLLWIGCTRPALEACGCPDGIAGHAVVLDGACSCLPHGDPTLDPEDAVLVELGAGATPDWPAIDGALATSDVIVRFTGTLDEKLWVERTDDGPYRLVLDGGGGSDRVVVPGIGTAYEGPPVHRVTVRGFDVTGSRDKGIHWWAGDDVWIEDVLVHANRGSPAVYLEYSARSGVASRGFRVRNSHVWDQRGECIYIGGAEGEDLDSHRDVEIAHNLVHDCREPFDTKHDGINVKDRLSDVRVVGNVVGRADWGIEVASPGLYAHNLVFDTDREGFQVSDAFQPTGGLVFRDNVVLRPGHDGFHLAATEGPMPGMVVEGATVVGAGKAGVLTGAERSLALSLERVAVFGSRYGYQGWGEGLELEAGSCTMGGNDTDLGGPYVGLVCDGAAPPDVARPAGPDGVFFTPDDPWRVPGGAELPE